jgi:hypothetical protein
MRHHPLLVAATLALLAACSTPYNSPVVVRDSTPFPGIATVIRDDVKHPVDVVLVHGMCTHDVGWARTTMDNITRTIRSNTEAAPEPPPVGMAANQIQVVERTDQAAGGTVHFHSLVWSPMSAALKAQLAYDSTGTPTDCAKDGECRPKRAHFNGQIKDSLLNDCLSDAMIYQGVSHPMMKQTMIDTVAKVLESAEQSAGDAPGPLIVVAESLGSKILFDALADMLQPEAPPRLHELGQRAARRMAIVFMVGNQLPILGLAEQNVDPAISAHGPPDALQRFLSLRRSQQQKSPQSERLGKLAIVAFSDPNDLLSYRLLPSRYAGPDVMIADVLVSNSTTWLGLLEDPFGAHLDYLKNPNVGGIIACGWPRSPVCH